MIKKIIAVFASFILLTQSVCAEQISSWAEKEYIKMSRAAFLNTYLIEGKMTDNISRIDFCRLIMKVYSIYNKVSVNEEDELIFSDTQNEDVLKAYKAEIVNGKGDGIFDPDGLITRQEMSVMISRLLRSFPIRYIKNENQIRSFKTRFKDHPDTADWAISDMAAICYYDIIGGVGNDRVEPLSNATKEQAVCMLNRVVDNFVTHTDNYTLPEISVEVSQDKKSADICWYYPGSVKYFSVLIKDSDYSGEVKNIKGTKNTVEDYLVNFDKSGVYTVYVTAVLDDGSEIVSLPYEFNKETVKKEIEVQQNNTQEENVPEKENETKEEMNKTEDTKTENEEKEDNSQKEDEQTDSSTDKNLFLGQSAITEKEQRVFPLGHYFTTKEEAEEYMTEVTFPVWRLKEDGEKVASEKTIMVNKALAEDVISIFTEIFNDPSQFLIKDVGGYYWRNTAYGKISHHSYGTCIDINYNENYYVTPEGEAVTGSYWKPGEDPYSIAEDSIVVKTFAQYGWLWGGNAWGPTYNKDYMHFTYLGK